MNRADEHRKKKDGCHGAAWDDAGQYPGIFTKLDNPDTEVLLVGTNPASTQQATVLLGTVTLGVVALSFLFIALGAACAPMQDPSRRRGKRRTPRCRAPGRACRRAPS